MNDLIPKPNLSPATHLGRLKADKMLELPCGRKVWSFWRKGEGPLSDRSVPRDMAMVTLMPDRQTFMLSFFPNDDSMRQVVDKLPLSKLGEAVEDLINAGFPVQPGHNPARSGQSAKPEVQDQQLTLAGRSGHD